MTETMKHFMEKVSKNEELKEKIKSLGTEEIIALAKEMILK